MEQSLQHLRSRVRSRSSVIFFEHFFTWNCKIRQKHEKEVRNDTSKKFHEASKEQGFILSELANNQFHHLNRCGGQVVNMLAFYAKIRVQILLKTTYFCVKFVYDKKRKNKAATCIILPCQGTYLLLHLKLQFHFLPFWTKCRFLSEIPCLPFQIFPFSLKGKWERERDPAMPNLGSNWMFCHWKVVRVCNKLNPVIVGTQHRELPI